MEISLSDKPDKWQLVLLVNKYPASELVKSKSIVVRISYRELVKLAGDSTYEQNLATKSRLLLQICDKFQLVGFIS